MSAAGRYCALAALGLGCQPAPPWIWCEPERGTTVETRALEVTVELQAVQIAPIGVDQVVSGTLEISRPTGEAIAFNRFPNVEIGYCNNGDVVVSTGEIELSLVMPGGQIAAFEEQAIETGETTDLIGAYARGDWPLEELPASLRGLVDSVPAPDGRQDVGLHVISLVSPSGDHVEGFVDIAYFNEDNTQRVDIFTANFSPLE